MNYSPSAFFSGTPTLTWPSLPVDTTLMGSADSATCMFSGILILHSSLPSKSATVVVAEGIPPVACCLVEKIRKWEYVNLDDLFHSFPEQLNGQVMAMQTDQRSHNSKDISSILSWLQVLSCSPVIRGHNQRGKDLQDSQWSRYDQNFCEWAAAKGLCKWGKLTLP